jgi:hypothetical protein
VRGIYNKAQYLSNAHHTNADHLDKLAAGNVFIAKAEEAQAISCVCRYRLNPITVQINPVAEQAPAFWLAYPGSGRKKKGSHPPDQPIDSAP